MRKMLRAMVWGVLVFGALCSGGKAQSFYARGDDADFTLDQEDEGMAYSFVLHGPPDHGDIGFQSGDVEQKGFGEFEGDLGEKAEGEEDQSKEKGSGLGKIRISLPDPETAVVAAPEIKRDSHTLQLSGTYKLLDEEDRTERSKKRFESADAVLNKVYAQVKTEVGKKGEAGLRDAEREWLAHRDRMAEAAIHSAEENAPKNFEYWDTAAELTSDRTQFLRNYSGKRVAPGLSGEYVDGYGGHLTVKERKSGMEFSMEVVRGPSASNGEIEGDAAKAKSGFIFRDQPEPSEDRKPTVLTFRPKDGHIIEVKGENTDYYHGASAYFDGTYFKQRPLK